MSGDEAARSEEFQGDGRAQIRASTLAVAAVCTTGRGPNAICAPLNSGRTLARRAIRRRRLLLALRSLGDDRNAGTRSFSRHGRKNVELPNDYANDIATRLGREAKHRGPKQARLWILEWWTVECGGGATAGGKRYGTDAYGLGNCWRLRAPLPAARPTAPRRKSAPSCGERADEADVTATPAARQTRDRRASRAPPPYSLQTGRLDLHLVSPSTRQVRHLPSLFRN